ncbi:hypothetical protein F4561_003072 [Lipingzhangella halophila]|uniref:Hint domain-containing protein n=1 Tax=Lipingzhangella halophila TaxID=1783352 RepID=A0A7W7RHT2_9ACTN|nr:polymorphic toxin-type HINT domain-containing protein [Lipingzhangella halophila]MBB4932252.1 hypothetical protein [Lipingzhangella halophila]
MLIRIHDPERGASFSNYAAVILLVAAILAGVVTSGVTDKPAELIQDALDQVTGASPGGSEPGDDGGAAPDDSSDEESDYASRGNGDGGGDGEDTSYASRDTGGDDDGGGDGEDTSYASRDTGDDDDGGGDGDDGCGWNVFCHGGNVADAAGDGLSNAWDWTTETSGNAWDWTTEKAGNVGDWFAETAGNVGDWFADTAAPHLKDFFGGLWEGIWGDISGIADIFTTNPIDTFSGMWEGIKEDPLSLLLSPEAREAWSNGDYAEAAGLATWDIGSWFIPGAGWASKIAKLKKLDGNGNDSDSNSNNDSEDNENNNTELACARNSFVPGTEVLMAGGGLQPIESVAVGDEVWAFDPATGEEGPRTVTALPSDEGEKTLVDLTVTDAAGGSATLTATDEHPFWAPEAGEWVDAIDLDPGTWLRTASGTWVQVSAVGIRDVADQRVHNLAVDDLHTYYVDAGAGTALVHNEDCAPASQEAVNDWRQYWADEGQAYSKKRNVAVADINIDGLDNRQLAGTSGPDRPGSTPMPEDQRYTANTNADSEQKILESLAEELNPRDADGNYPETRPDIEGTIELYSERRPCPSCDGVIEQFEREFPNIDVNVTWG